MLFLHYKGKLLTKVFTIYSKNQTMMMMMMIIIIIIIVIVIYLSWIWATC